ncbi:MAG: GNAT family N-acetyltransferase [Mobilitalea sp.]
MKGKDELVQEPISFDPVITKEQIKAVADLAEIVWHEHYDLIIGKEQVDYMIGKFQSVSAMITQMEEDSYEYYKIISPTGDAGYFAFRREEEGIFLSKIYILRQFRGRNYARKALDFMEEICKTENLKKIWLTVNRNNETSIKIYENLGFKKIRTQVADIGSGYVMDDFVMEKAI